MHHTIAKFVKLKIYVVVTSVPWARLFSKAGVLIKEPNTRLRIKYLQKIYA